MSKKSKGGGMGTMFLNSFRYTVGYIERLCKNFIAQIKWISRTGQSFYRGTISWHSRSFTPSNAWNYFYGIMIGIIMIFIFFPILTIWSILKSI
ncbi:MAG: hypothetical protein PHT84_01585 [Candidatus Pacebacteria bacterium]|jgi:hypothetical protein|nr:hypothetical protein [Candidatus Paceibacterota bacterium]